MTRLLVLFATTDGHSETVARRIAATSTAANIETSILEIRRAKGADLRSFDSVILIASVHFGKHQRVAKKFVTANRERLSAMRSAFVSVSGSANEAATRDVAAKCADEFQTQTGWSPAARYLCGGAIKFTKYNPLMRFVMKRMSASHGRDLDTHRDYEYTDWNALDDFVTSFLQASRTRAA